MRARPWACAVLTASALAYVAGGCRDKETPSGARDQENAGAGNTSGTNPATPSLFGGRPVLECLEDNDCTPRPAEPGSIGNAELVSARCIHDTFNSLPNCDCQIEGMPTSADGGGAGSYGGSLIAGIRPNGCSEFSFLGCLYCENEFPGCDVDVPTSCDAVCGDLIERFNAQWQRTVEVKTHHAECVMEPEYYTCRVIYEVDGQCYTGPYGRSEPAPFDCSLPKDDVLANYFDSPTQPSCEPRADVACSSSVDCPRGLACTSGVCKGCNLNCDYTEGDIGQCQGGGKCANGETCAMGTCVPDPNVSCTSFTECPEGLQCLLSGITTAGRGNENTRSFCGGSRTRD